MITINIVGIMSVIMAMGNHMGKIQWIPEIGDPTIMGWLTVIIYFFISLMCFKSFLVTNKVNKIRKFWLLLTLVLIFLGINKQLDLQTLFTEIIKNMAIEQGWYENRRVVQVGFIISIAVFGSVMLIGLFNKYRKINNNIKITLIGCIILFSFILIRASSFHHMDVFINIKFADIKMNWLLEIGGLIIISVGTYNYLKSRNNA